MEVAHVFISGFVQGVGFRHFIKRTAQELGLKGWVRNLPDGRVDALFQGEKGLIEKMIKFCKKGPFLSEVGDVTVFFDDELIKSAEKFNNFEIVI